MNRLTRWLKFNLVGAIGVPVQLGALTLSSRWIPGHYLIASAAAVSCTLLHNFVWHVTYTWRDRRGKSALLAQFPFFFLSNGLVSIAGNVSFMWFFVRHCHLPLLIANLLSILLSSLANFTLADKLAFPRRVILLQTPSGAAESRLRT